MEEDHESVQSLDVKSTHVDSMAYSEKKQVQYTYINWFIAGIMVLLSIILIIRIRWPTN